jgi:hypothetical protein
VGRDPIAILPAGIKACAGPIFLVLAQETGVQFRSVVCCTTEVRMPARLVSLLLVLLAVPAVSQQSSIEARISQRIQDHEQKIERVMTAPKLDARAARLQATHHDAEELSALSASVQSDLQQLRKGLLAKDLDEKLKKMEKLSKKLRRDMEP